MSRREPVAIWTSCESPMAVGAQAGVAFHPFGNDRRLYGGVRRLHDARHQPVYPARPGHGVGRGLSVEGRKIIAITSGGRAKKMAGAVLKRSSRRSRVPLRNARLSCPAKAQHIGFVLPNKI
jgi:hypothetical protein